MFNNYESGFKYKYGNENIYRRMYEANQGFNRNVKLLRIDHAKIAKSSKNYKPFSKTVFDILFFLTDETFASLWLQGGINGKTSFIN